MKWLWICLVFTACNSGDKKIAQQSLSSVSDQSEEILRDDTNAIQIRLNASNQAMIEGKVVDSTQIHNTIRLAKKSKGDTATVVLHLKGDTAFGMFTLVHLTLEQLLQEERDSVAQIRFNTDFGNLNDTQQAIIKRKHHLRIIEKMQR